SRAREVIVSRSIWLSVVVLAAISLTPARAQRAAISSKPETPFKLATFEAQGRVRVGLTSGSRLLDAAEASAFLTQKAGLPAVSVPREMRELIETYDRTSPRLYQIANYFRDAGSDALPFAFEVAKVSIKAPIKYPANILCIAAN